MRKSIYFKQITAAFMVFVMAASLVLAAPAGPFISAAAAYESVYPTRIREEIINVDLEDCETGKNVSSIGLPWADAGNSQNDYPYVCEIDGGKAICYEGVHAYATFTSPGSTEVTGKLWVDIDLKLPAEYTRYTLQIGDFTHPDRAIICFYSDQDRMRAMYVQDPDGGVKHVDLAYEIPRDEWFTVSVWFDTENQRYRVYLNGEQVGDEMNFYHKFDYLLNGTEPSAAAFAKLSYASNGSAAEEADAKIYLDNYRLSYARSINPIDTIEITVDKGTEYIFPETYMVQLDNGSLKEVAAKYTPVSSELDTNTLGSYQYMLELEYYDEPITVWYYVKDRKIASIDTIYEKVYKDENYKLPATITATMDDGSNAQIPVTWNGVADVSKVGTTIFEGRVEGWSEPVTLNLEVVANAVLRADDLYIGVAKDSEYVMPSQIDVIQTNHKYGKANVTWEEAAQSIDTSKTGKYEFYGTAEGYSDTVKLYVTVYEEDPDLKNIMDVLTEFYDNCLNIARDRSEWFPEEYAAGYDPATPDKVSDNPHSPLFSMGINRDTNTHALWPAVSEKMPLAVPATQGPLWKGLMGMTAITGDPKYHESVEEAHDFLVNNKISDTSHMIMWGDHILQQFNDPELDMQSEEDSYSYMTHQLECDYPEWDILFSQNPEATERYIKAFWTAHFNGQKRGILLNTMEFSRHASLKNIWDVNLVDHIFESRYDFSEAYVHKESLNALTFVNAAVDYAWAAVKLWEHTGDEGALHYARKILWCYHAAADPVTGLVPFQFSDTGGMSNSFIGDVYEDNYKSSFPEGRAKSSFSKVYKNPEKYGTTAEKVNDSWLLNQGKCGGGSFYMPMICFDIADVVGGEVGAEIEQWGIEALKGFVNYTYDHRTGLGNAGMTDGTILDDYKPEFKAYYRDGGSTYTPFNITSDMSWVLLDGYERTHDPDIWECLRSVCMSFSLGDIGTAPGENIDIDIYTDCDDTNMVLTLSRLYEITGADEYYQLAKRLVMRIINERYINGFFYKSELGAYARLADPTPYAILYFVAAAKGVSKMIPHYQGESFDFQTNYVEDNGQLKSYYGYSLFNKTIVSEVLPSAVLCDIKELTLKVGDQYMINAEAIPEDADDVTLEWYVDNTGCCKVEDGYVTALSPGTCIVTAEAASGVTADIQVTVTQ
ncbi:MAG: Ig-like domain-containing protein [Clostridia bacterium]|nr:Ig-like domain-containing protein [Clostridia bacterium]